MKISRTVVGVDTEKRVFQLYWVDMETGEIVDLRLTRTKFLEVARFVGQLGGLIKVYSSCRSCRQNPFASISLPLLLRLWGCGQGA